MRSKLAKIKVECAAAEERETAERARSTALRTEAEAQAKERKDHLASEAKARQARQQDGRVRRHR